MKKTKIQLIFTLILVMLAAAMMTASAQEIAKNDSKASTKAEAKPDPMELTVEEKALLRPIFEDFNKWNGKANDAAVALDKSVTASSTEIENLQLLLAAKDLRQARLELQKLRVQFVAWEKEGKEKRKCEECRFDEAIGKFIKSSSK